MLYRKCASFLKGSLFAAAESSWVSQGKRKCYQAMVISKQYNAISTSASQLDLCCLLTHVGNAISSRINQGLAPKPCCFYTAASATHDDSLHPPALCAPIFWHDGNCHARDCPSLPMNMTTAPKGLLIRPLFHNRTVSSEYTKGPTEKDNRDI